MLASLLGPVSLSTKTESRLTTKKYDGEIASGASQYAPEVGFSKFMTFYNTLGLGRTSTAPSS